MNAPEKETKSVRADVMKAIAKGEIHMRPRWHFILLSALSITGIFIVLLTLLYAASLAVFFLRDSGTLFTPSFGLRGWFILAHSLPWLLILFLLVFVVVLELLVRRYAFVYKKPLLTSALGIIALIVLGGFVIAQAPFHHQMMISARRGQLPAPFMMLYRDLRSPPPTGTYHGQIAAITKGGFVIVDEDGAGTTTVLITRQTRLPYGEDFTAGERVVVVGDTVATDTVRAFGVQQIDEYPAQ